MQNNYYNIKTYEPYLVRKLFSIGADEGNRIPVTALARPYSNH